MVSAGLQGTQFSVPSESAGVVRGGALFHASKPIHIMIKYLLLVALAIILTSCEGLNVKFQGEKGSYTYSSKGGLVITPKAIQVIEPAK